MRSLSGAGSDRLVVRWVRFGETEWLLLSSGAPGARRVDERGCHVAAVSWTRTRQLVFEGGDNVAVPFAVLEELVRRGQRWSWASSGGRRDG